MLWTAAWSIATADAPDRCPECVALAAAEAGS